MILVECAPPESVAILVCWQAVDVVGTAVRELTTTEELASVVGNKPSTNPVLIVWDAREDGTRSCRTKKEGSHIWCACQRPTYTAKNVDAMPRFSDVAGV